MPLAEKMVSYLSLLYMYPKSLGLWFDMITIISAGSSFVGMDIEQDEENETSGKSGTAKTQQNAELFNPAPPSTPMPLR